MATAVPSRLANQASHHTGCVVCGDSAATSARNGVSSCRPCREFFRRHSITNPSPTACSRGGSCRLTRGSRTTCAPCRMRRCIDAGMRVDPAEPPSQGATANDDIVCAACGRINRAKRTITCSECSHSSHLTCVRITQAQASQLPTWHCDTCLRSEALQDAVHDTPTADNRAPPPDMSAALADLKASTKVMQHVPRGQRHRVASDLAGVITAALEQRTPMSWCAFSLTLTIVPLPTHLLPKHPPLGDHLHPQERPATKPLLSVLDQSVLTAISVPPCD